MKDILILYSGGLDSLIMDRFAKVNYPEYNIKKVWFNIGQEYNYKEKRSLPNDVEIRHVDWNASGYIKDTVSKDGNIFIPGRNAVLIMLAASIYTPDQIWLGALQGETHKKATDKNWKFLKLINKCISYTYSPFKNIEVHFPLAEYNLNKKTAVEWALNNGITQKQILNTSSCLSSVDGHCGECVVCLRRWGIFGQLGFKEPYIIEPLSTKFSIEYCLSLYEKEKSRRDEIVPYIKQLYNLKTDNEVKQFLNNKLNTIQ